MEKVLIAGRPISWPDIVRYWAPVIAFASLIFYLSAQQHPEERLPEFLLKRVSDKVLHTVEFAILAILCCRAFRWAAGPRAAGRAVPLAVAVASLYAATDELHQLFVPFREASWLDWVADTFGAALGSWGWSRFMSRTED